MIIRKLTDKELYQLIKTAPESETDNLLKLCAELEIMPYDFFERYGHKFFGILNEERPIYFATITKQNGKYEFFTIINSGVREQFSLFKYSKRELIKWLNEVKEIYATMPKKNINNLRWTERLGFQKVNEDKELITLRIGG